MLLSEEWGALASVSASKHLPVDGTSCFNDMKFYTFEPVSFVPFEPKLIDLNLLSVKQKEFLNRFNVKARNTVGIELQKQGRERGLRWLLSRTEHIPVNDCRNHSPGGIEPCHFMILCLVASLVFW
ncbi:Xaa-Pro aminopeptidase 1 like protein [Argiope bruennichi]|uniref:Xaa-Pro aminopeptidase 1 like protein n=1 Tax=Argiope bruennichi TaxID=94029 RepID=A0A8T0FYW0_ARGBR|nr:Xaa-Pro aminopeptidase 1 like protein [Argiope bruennichi]